MPTYDFACLTCDIQVERYFAFNEEQHVDCEKCGNAMVRVYNAPPAHFKGGGWGGQ